MELIYHCYKKKDMGFFRGGGGPTDYLFFLNSLHLT